MKHTNQPKEQKQHQSDNTVGLNSDDISMLNQVLQQVQGISCVSCPAEYDTTEQAIAAE